MFKRLMMMLLTIAFVSSGVAFAEVPELNKAQTLIEKMEHLQSELTAAQLYETQVAIKVNEDPKYAGSAGYLLPNFQNRTCTLFIDPDAVVAGGFDTGLALRFFVYHEKAHCDLYMAPKDILPVEGLAESQSRLMSDLVVFEFLHPSMPRRMNGYNFYHENYADVKAIAVLMLLGRTAEEVQKILAWRHKTAGVMDTHNTHGALEEAAGTDWKSMAPEARDTHVAHLASKEMVEGFLKKTFGMGTAGFDAPSLMRGSVQTALSILRFKYTEAEQKEFLQRRLKEVGDSRNPTWTVFAELVGEGLADEKLIEEYFTRRYGVKEAELGGMNEQLRK